MAVQGFDVPCLALTSGRGLTRSRSRHRFGSTPSTSPTASCATPACPAAPTRGTWMRTRTRSPTAMRIEVLSLAGEPVWVPVPVGRV
eukprot:2904990-Rhodomonas_salina.3